MNDPIADMLTRIRNAITARKTKVIIPASKLKLRLAEVLRDEGFIGPVSFEGDSKQGEITIDLKYDHNSRNAIEGIRRISKPGQRSYRGHAKMPHVRSGVGVAILTTSRGIMTDRDARRARLGGEVLCEVW